MRVHALAAVVGHVMPCTMIIRCAVRARGPQYDRLSNARSRGSKSSIAVCVRPVPFVRLLPVNSRGHADPSVFSVVSPVPAGIRADPHLVWISQHMFSGHTSLSSRAVQPARASRRTRPCAERSAVATEHCRAAPTRAGEGEGNLCLLPCLRAGWPRLTTRRSLSSGQREELMQNRQKVEEATQFLAHEAESKIKVRSGRFAART